MRIMSDKLKGYMFLIVCMCVIKGLSLNVQAGSTGYSPEAELYEINSDSGYNISGEYLTDKFVYGAESICRLTIAGDINRQEEYKDYTAYGVNDVISFEYKYNDLYHTKNKSNWNLVSDEVKNVAGEDLDKKVQEGVIIIQKSEDGETWGKPTKVIYDAFKKSIDDSTIIYTTSLDEIKQGTYYRIIVAYAMQHKVGTENGFLGLDKDIYEQKNFVEKYEFYVCTDNNHVVLRDCMTRNELATNGYVQYGFYIEKNGSGDSVTVKRNMANAKEVDTYAIFTEPGDYDIEITTKLGKKYNYDIKVMEGITTVNVEPVVFECEKGEGFENGIQVTGNTKYGIKSYTSAKIAQSASFVTTKSTHNGFDAYGVNGDKVAIFLELNYPEKLIDNGWQVTYSEWGKKEKQKVCGLQTGEIGKGAVIVQTSSTGKEGDWINVDKGRYANGLYTTDFGEFYAPDEDMLIYMPDGNAVLSGVYVRILFAYQVYQKSEKQYIDCLEKYEFYLCSNDLRAVTFHNLSVEESLQEIYGDVDANTMEVYKSAETLLSNTGTTTGFLIDTKLNPTVEYTVVREGVTLAIPWNNKYTEDGRYDIHLKSAVGDEQTVTIYVDKSSNEEALKRYFGEGLIQGKRIYDEGEYPVYEGGLTSYNLVEVNEQNMPIYGTIKNITTGGLIEFEPSREARTGTISEEGDYVATFTTGVDSDLQVGDVRVFTFKFRIIKEGSAPGPVVNKQSFERYAHTNISDSYPLYYGVTYQSAGKGNITIAFYDRKAAVNFANSYERGMVEKQSDGTFRYKGSLGVMQKVKYDSGWDLATATNYFAEQAVQELYFDLKDKNTYRTLKEDLIESTANLRTLELNNSVVIFADGQKELFMNVDALPIISEKKYEYIDAGLSAVPQNGTNDFEFVKDKYGCDSNTVTITDCNNKSYNIEYNKGVGNQLKQAGCPSGIVTITETTIYGDATSYQAVYIAESDNTAKVDLLYYDSGKENHIVVDASSSVGSMEVDAFAIDKIMDELDSYSFVCIVKDNDMKAVYCKEQVGKAAWSEAGTYTVRVANRLGYDYSFDVVVRESDYSVITFEGEGTESVKNLITEFGAKNVALPQASREGYEFLGYEDKNGKFYKDTIEVVQFKNELTLTAVWQVKETETVMDEVDNELTVVDENNMAPQVVITAVLVACVCVVAMVVISKLKKNKVKDEE